MPEEAAYHVPPTITPPQRSTIRLRITLCLAVFGMAVFVFITSLLSLISRYFFIVSASLPLSELVIDGIFLILLAGAAIPFSLLSYRAAFHQRRYLTGTSTAVQARRSVITLVKAGIIIPAITILAYGLWYLIDIFFISGVPG
jgi:hypothetical protein